MGWPLEDQWLAHQCNKILSQVMKCISHTVPNVNSPCGSHWEPCSSGRNTGKRWL